jgi:hemin uptake protein HemP
VAVTAVADGTFQKGAAREFSERQEPRRIESPALFEGGREVVIVHQGQTYRLRITKADKLILTK